MSEPVHTGHCTCGAIRFELDAPLLGAVYCHCTRCQRRTGAAAGASAVADRESFRIVAGEQLLSYWQPDEPGGGKKYFCSVCGSGTHVLREAMPDTVMVRLGLIDGDPGVRPQLRQYVDDAAVWEPIPEDGLTRFGGKAQQ